MNMGRLYSRAKYQDYDKATYSFEWALRDDPGREVTHNDWDLQFGYGGDYFHVDMTGGDRSRLIDLGELEWKDLDEDSIEIPQPKERGERYPQLPVHMGHIYLARTFDRDSDLTTLFRVERFIPSTSVDFSWKVIAGKPQRVARARIQEDVIGFEWANANSESPGVVTGSVVSTPSTPTTPSTPEEGPRIRIPSGPGTNGMDAGKDENYKTGIATLYCADPLSSTWSFADNKEGYVFQDHMVKNGESDLSFNGYADHSFSVGIEGGVTGAIVNLGTSESLRGKYGYSETVGGGQGFASIRFEGGRFVILKNYQEQSTQLLEEGNSILGDVTESCASALIHNGHYYLMRLVDRHEPIFERIVKFKVIAYQPDVSVTIRWVLLKDRP